MRAVKKKLKHVKIKNRTYGNALKGVCIYYEGKKPSNLKKDGMISFGKHILQKLQRKFPGNYKWIITDSDSHIDLFRGKYLVYTSKTLLSKMGGESITRNRDIKNDIVDHFFAATYPNHFAAEDIQVYVPGLLSKVISPAMIPQLSSEDRDVLNKFLPGYIASESISSVNLLKAQAQIKSLKELAAYLKKAIQSKHAESWWQKYIRDNILLIQQGYIKAIEKMNVAIGNTKLPDFALITHDNYLDILEIKKPDTNLLLPDDSRGNYYFDKEISKAIIQTENYMSQVHRHGDAIRSYLIDKHKIQLQVLRPRGIILAGNASILTEQKQKDDLRLLTQGLKDVVIVTYDELLSRLENYIDVLEAHTKK